MNKKSQNNLGRAASPPLTAENNYATEPPLAAMRYPTFTSKTAGFPSTISTPSNTRLHCRASQSQTVSYEYKKIHQHFSLQKTEVQK